MIENTPEERQKQALRITMTTCDFLSEERAPALIPQLLLNLTWHSPQSLGLNHRAGFPRLTPSCHSPFPWNRHFHSPVNYNACFILPTPLLWQNALATSASVCRTIGRNPIPQELQIVLHQFGFFQNFAHAHDFTFTAAERVLSSRPAVDCVVGNHQPSSNHQMRTSCPDHRKPSPHREKPQWCPACLPSA